MRFTASLFLLLLLSFPSYALDLKGSFSQGGFVYGKTMPEADVQLNDTDIPVDEDGYFILGFGRDHPDTATLTINAPNGSQSVRHFNVRQRDFDIERIDNLPDSKVTPRTKAQIDQIVSEQTLKKNAYADIHFSVDGFKQDFIWPVKGRISGNWGSQRILNGVPKRPHYGMDIAAPDGTNIIAPADGIVTLAQEDMYFEGGTLFIDHGQGLVSIMIHLSELLVETGDTVKQGDLIGKVGMTGRTTGPHLHWGLRLRGTTNLDPALILPEQ